MSTKNIYLFKVLIHDTTGNVEIPVNQFKKLFHFVFQQNCINSALKLTNEDVEPMVLDIIDDNDAYLFARLNRKRPNNSMQKRNYTTYETTDVLPADEIANNGVELFTYCILGYRHGILSIVNSKGAPGDSALARVFSMYNTRYSLETVPIPNNDLINELLDGGTPEINKGQIEIARPDAQILKDMFGFSELGVLQTVQENTASLVFEIKPDFRGALSNDKNVIINLIKQLQNNKRKYNSVILSGKPNVGERQRRYDLYEEYFKYPISVNEFRQESGEKLEIDKVIIAHQYLEEMKSVYDEFKDIILTFSNN